MLGNIWLSLAFIITLVSSTGFIYKSYSDIQEAKDIKEHYEIISDIKTLIAKQYNKNLEDITRDEIIAHLPKGENWGKVLHLDRNKNTDLTDVANTFINEDGKIEIKEDEKLKLLALKSKLKNITDLSNISLEDGKYTFEIGKEEKNSIIKDANIEDNLIKAISSLSKDILYTVNPDKTDILEKVLEKFTPYKDLHFDFLEDTETSISEVERKIRQTAYFKLKIKEKLYKNESSLETKLYNELKDEL